MPCNCCQISGRTFNDAAARSSLRQYRRHGPANQTRELLAAVRSRRLTDATLLDIGGGVGAIHQELLGDTAAHATHVDASGAYLRAAEEEAARRGNSARVRFIQADFTDVAGDLPPADIVTLDRVICCYPDFRSLLTAAAGHARQVLAMSYPREVWYVRAAVRLMDLFQSLRRDPFRFFVHPVADMEKILEASGLRRVSRKQLGFWEITLYMRS